MKDFRPLLSCKLGNSAQLIVGWGNILSFPLSEFPRSQYKRAGNFKKNYVVLFYPIFIHNNLDYRVLCTVSRITSNLPIKVHIVANQDPPKNQLSALQAHLGLLV